MQTAQAGLAVSTGRLRHRFANGREVSLHVPLDLAPGQAAIVTGPSGCGKSTLLRALAGCLPEGGETTWDADVLPEHAVLALQDPESQLFCSTVEEEVGFGISGIESAGRIADRIQEALDAVGISSLRERNVEALSVGEKYRVVLAALLAMRPRMLLLDEPFSQLDAAGRMQLRALIERQKHEGRTVIVTAHEMPPGDGLWDVYLELDSRDACRLSPGLSPGKLPARTALTESRREECALRATCLDLPRASTTHILGDNGAGKSTLLRSVAQELKDSRIGYLPQNVDLMLFEATIEQEVGFTLQRMKLAPGDRRTRIAETLSLCGLSALALQPPLCLSHGERQMVALASVIAAQPEALLLDEPLAGLDRALSLHVLAILENCAHALGMAVLLASHAPLPGRWADRRFILQGGRLHEAA